MADPNNKATSCRLLGATCMCLPGQCAVGLAAPAFAAPAVPAVDALTRYDNVVDGPDLLSMRPVPDGQWFKRADVLALLATPSTAPDEPVKAADRVTDGIFTSILSANGAIMHNALKAAGRPVRQVVSRADSAGLAHPADAGAVAVEQAKPIDRAEILRIARQLDRTVKMWSDAPLNVRLAVAEFNDVFDESASQPQATPLEATSERRGPAAAVRAAERIDAMHTGVVGVFAAIKAESQAAAQGEATIDPDEPTAREQLIACLGDDAAKLEAENPGCEMAQTMREAAVMLEAISEQAESIDTAEFHALADAYHCADQAELDVAYDALVRHVDDYISRLAKIERGEATSERTEK